MEYYEPTVSCSPEAGAVMAIAGAPPVPSMSVDVTVPQLTSVCIVEGPMEKRVAPAGPPEVYENRHRRQLAVHEGRGNGRPTEGGRSAQDISKGASPGRAVECGIVLSYPRSPSARCPRSLAVDPASHSAEQAREAPAGPWPPWTVRWVTDGGIGPDENRQCWCVRKEYTPRSARCDHQTKTAPGHQETRQAEAHFG